MRLVNAAREGSQTYFGTIADFVGKIVDIQNRTSGTHFAGLIESATFTPLPDGLGRDALYFEVRGAGRVGGSPSMTLTIVGGERRWKIGFLSFDKADDVVVRFR